MLTGSAWSCRPNVGRGLASSLCGGAGNCVKRALPSCILLPRREEFFERIFFIRDFKFSLKILIRRWKRCFASTKVYQPRLLQLEERIAAHPSLILLASLSFSIRSCSSFGSFSSRERSSTWHWKAYSNGSNAAMSFSLSRFAGNSADSRCCLSDNTIR